MDFQNDDGANFEQKTYLIFANHKLRTIIHDKAFASKIVSLKIHIYCRGYEYKWWWYFWFSPQFFFDISSHHGCDIDSNDDIIHHDL